MANAKTARDWQCQECGKRLTLKQAERAMNGPNGCPKCGGSDIDVNVTETPSDSPAIAAEVDRLYSVSR